MNGRFPIITLAAAACLLAASAGAHAQAENSTPNEVHVDVVLDSPESATAYVLQKWTGARAQSLRQSLDVYFGAADGVLTPSEIDRIRVAAEDDMRNKTLPWLWMDQGVAYIHNVSISFVNASGSVDSAEPIETTHQMALDLQNVTEADTHEVVISPLWNGTMTIQAPTGWGIQNASGLDDVQQDTTRVEGSMLAARDVRVLLVPESALQTPEDSGAGTESTEPPGASTIPASSVVAAAGAVAVAAALVATRRSRR